MYFLQQQSKMEVDVNKIPLRCCSKAVTTA
jgi:hypothetical protein